MISMIASVGRNNELGLNNKLIWKIPDDLKFFKETTMGHTLVMGYNTYKSLPGTLPGRKMIVISDGELDGVETVKTSSEILDKYLNSQEEVFIIGGAITYSEFINYASKLYLTEVDSECKNADAYFPKFDKKKWQRKVIRKNKYMDINYSICLYERDI